MKKIETCPPMGWNSYDNYDTAVTEAQVRANAEYMAAHLKQAGYEYVVVDIQWYAPLAATQRDKYQYIPFERHAIDAYGRFQPAENRFPSAAGGQGFAPLADYVHSLGLKFGIHIMRGIPREAVHGRMQVFGTNYTAEQLAKPSPVCSWNPDMYAVDSSAPGAQAYYDGLIQLYTAWGVDFIKCDDICFIGGKEPYGARGEIELLHDAIARINPELVLSLSPGPALIEEAWHLRQHANMWRMTDDLWDNWEQLKEMFGRCELWQLHVGDGAWPDCDMLPLGYIGEKFGEGRQCRLSHTEQETMFTLWCIFRSPLMLGSDLPRMDAWTKALVTNPELLGIHQHGVQPRLAVKQGDIRVWLNENRAMGQRYQAVFNLGDEDCRWEGISLKAHGCRLLRL